MYKDSSARGMAVTLSVKNQKILTLSCENKIISFKVRRILYLKGSVSLGFANKDHPMPLERHWGMTKFLRATWKGGLILSKP